MPVIADLGGFKVAMYFEDHNPPHYHVLGPGWRAAFAIADGKLLRGRCPLAAKKAVKAWAAENEAVLREKWIQLNERDD